MLTPARILRQVITRSACPASIRRASCLSTIQGRSLVESSIWGDRRAFASINCRRQDVEPIGDGLTEPERLLPAIKARESANKLPISCPGCGAPSQTVDPGSPGFYGSRMSKKAHRRTEADEEDAIYANALKSGLLTRDTSMEKASSESQPQTPDTPICDRCHYLIYQSRGNSIVHPSMQSIEQIISESPHKQNHIYHVLDAADFPLSLIPNLQSALDLPRLRTQNRRSKHLSYIRGRTAEVSFIITRSDLLAPKKEQVDSLLPIMRETLRDALGRAGKNLRLGNVRCVSAHRGWWTKTVKEEIYNRGGAGWVVGKVNVGKSALFEAVFPKGRNQGDVNLRSIREREQRQSETQELSDEERLATYQPTLPDGAEGFASSPGELADPSASTAPSASYNPSTITVVQAEQESVAAEQGSAMPVVIEEGEEDLLDDMSLLPPPQPETAYPRMPIVSSLPGTTASPIRIPFGNGKGELIDLPGVDRSSLEKHVKPEYRKELIMKSRVVPEQHTIKPGQSMLLGGLIKITPRADDLIVLAYPFVPIDPHVTGNEKAAAIQTGVHPGSGEAYTGNVTTIATSNAQGKMKSAGTFPIKWDVTKRRSGPLTAKEAGHMLAKNLPFTVYGADILIEGVGWVELTCQVRKGRPVYISETSQDSLGASISRREIASGFPEVEIFSPEGKFVGIRPPLNAWLLGGPKKVAKHARKSRPRQTISFKRRQEGGKKGGAKMVANVD